MNGNPEINEAVPRRRWWRPLAVGLLLVVAAVGLLRYFLPGLPQIDEAELAAAAARWKANEVRDYDLTVEIRGRQSGKIQTTVRNGEPIAMTRNGIAMKEPRTWRPWTVPGLFETIETDFENARRPAEKYGSADVQVVLRAEFDPQLGIPRKYLQQVFGRLDDLSWEVTQFERK